MNTRIIPLTSLSFVLLLILFSCSNSSHDNNVTIRVKLAGSSNELLFLERITVDGNMLMDSAKTDNHGEASFSFRTDDFEFLLLTDRARPGILLLAEKDEYIEVFTDNQNFSKNYQVKGSGGSALLQDLDRQKREVEHSLDSLGRLWLKERYSADNVNKKIEFDSISTAILEGYRADIKRFIDKYHTSPSAIIAVYQVIRDIDPLFTLEDHFDLFQNMANTLIHQYPNNPHVKDFAQRVADYQNERDAFLARESSLQPGMPAPPLKLLTTQGELFELNSLEGYPVLICFWDARKSESWDVNRKIHSVYQRYQPSGFKVVGVYTGQERQLLFNALKIEPMPWIHLFGNSSSEKLFNITKVPHLMMIGRDGNILYRTIQIDQLPGIIENIYNRSSTHKDSIAEQTAQ